MKKIQIEAFKLNNHNLIEKINSFAFILDIKGNFLYINHFCKSIIGYDPESLHGHNISKIVSNTHKQQILDITNKTNVHEQRLSKYSDNDLFSTNEIEIICKEGLKKVFLFSTHFNKFDNDDTQIYCILHDISDRRKLQNRVDAFNIFLDDLVNQRTKALKESEEQFRFVVNSAYDSIFMVQNNIFTLGNEAFFTMTGLSEDLVKNAKVQFIEIIDPSVREQVLSDLDLNFTNEKNHFVLNTKLRNINNELCDVEIHFSSIYSEDENRTLGIIHDIAQKLEYENQKLHSEKIRAISSYAVTTNDQINSPLNAILGYIELLESMIDEPKPVQVKAFNSIYDSINKIKLILEKLVAFTNESTNSKISTAKYNYGDYDMIDIKKKEDPPDA
jgi:PAS domain S-box-containing protein